MTLAHLNCSPSYVAASRTGNIFNEVQVGSESAEARNVSVYSMDGRRSIYYKQYKRHGITAKKQKK